MFARDYWKLTRLLVVCVVILGTSCNGNSTSKVLQDTTQTWLQNEEMKSETEVGSGVAGTDSNAKFSVQTGGGNLDPRPSASSGNETKTVGMVSFSPPPLVSGKEQENSAIRQRVTTPSAEGVPDDLSISRGPVSDSSLYTREFKVTEAPTLKSIEHEIPFPSQRGLDTSTPLPLGDETSSSEMDDSEAITLRETNDETYPSVVSNLSLDTEMVTFRTTDQQQSSSSRILYSTDAYSYDTNVESTDAYSYDTNEESTDAYSYNTNGESTDNSPLPFEPSNMTMQGSLFATKKTVDLVTTTVAVSLSATIIGDQITNENKSTAHKNGSYSSVPTQTQHINPDQSVITLGQSILIAVGIVVLIFVILGIATICVIRRKSQSKVILSTDNEKFFISRNHEDEPLSDGFVGRTKSSTVGMYSDVELELIEHSERQEVVLNNVAHDGEDTNRPKCLETTTKMRDISD